MSKAIQHHEDDHPHFVAQSTIGFEFHVSTVLLTSEDRFETMVFDQEHKEVLCRQTLSRDEAKKDHYWICGLLAEDRP